jgi:HSP20 family protein
MALVRHDGGEGTRMLEPLERGLFDWPVRSMEMWRHLLQDEDTIKVEEFIDGDQLVVRAELPGVDSERDIQVSIEDGALHIRAERRQERDVEERHMRRSELRYGSFSRTIALPTGTKESDIKAKYKDGILEVRAPIEDRASSKRSAIPVQRN